MVRPICETIRSVCTATMHVDRNSTCFVAIIIIWYSTQIQYIPPKCFRLLRRRAMELNWTKMHERVFSPRWNLTRRKQYAVKMSSGENSGDGIWRGDNIMRWNLTRRKYHAAKFTAAKISRGKIFCGVISGSEIYHGENPIFLVNFKSTENPLFYRFKILINSIINNLL